MNKPTQLKAIVYFIAVWGAAQAAFADSVELGALWHFDANNPGHADQSRLDASANRNDLNTIVNAEITAGKFRQGYLFNGADSVLTVLDDETLDATDALTLEAWINPTRDDAIQGIVGKCDGVAGERSYLLYLTDTNALALCLSADGTAHCTRSAISGGGKVPLNAWTHVAGTFDGTTVRVYVNGGAEGEATGVPFTIHSGTAPVSIGNFTQTEPAGNAFGGTIDEVRIWRRALSAEEIAASFDMGSGSADAIEETDTASGADMVVYTSHFAQSEVRASIAASADCCSIESMQIEAASPKRGEARLGDVTYSNGRRTATALVTSEVRAPKVKSVRLQVNLDDGSHFAVDVEETEPPPGTTDPILRHKSPWLLYGNDPAAMNILMETNSGVDNDSNHLNIVLNSSSKCKKRSSDCPRSYEKIVKDLWEDTRLWTFACSGLEPDTDYSYKICYRQTWISPWSWSSGTFHTAPRGMTTDLTFYATGDSRGGDKTGDVAAKIADDHDTNHGAFVLHTGDIVYRGGRVCHWDNAKIDCPWDDGYWFKDGVPDMLGEMPFFATVGNHDIDTDDPDYPGGLNVYYYYRYFKYPMYAFDTITQAEADKLYYRFDWGPAEIYSLTTYPMVNYCDYSAPVVPGTHQYNWLLDNLQGPGSFGYEDQGGGLAAADIDGNGVADLVAFNIDNPDGANHGYYRVGWNVSAGGETGSWTAPNQIPGWFGDQSQGGGIAAAGIDGNGKTDLVVFHIDHSTDGNHGFYRIGWNLAADGKVSSWTEPVEIPGWFGNDGQGGGIAIADIDHNGEPDLVAFHIDHPDGGNHGFYRIGWNVSGVGAVSSWTPPLQIPGWFGAESQGGGIAVLDVNGNGIPDLAAFNIDNPANGNYGYYRIGYDLNVDGTVDAGHWQGPIQIPDSIGDSSAGGGFAIADLDSEGAPDLVSLHIDDPKGGNHGYYRVGLNTGSSDTPQAWTPSQLVRDDTRATWKIVFFHGPPYDAGGDSGCHQPQIREYLQPLFEKYNVDVVLAGHEHYYARKTVNDIPYIVLGGGGAPIEGLNDPGSVDFSAGLYHYASFDINGDYLDIKAIDLDGNIFDALIVDRTPKPDFKATTTAIGSLPLKVNFSDESTGHVGHWSWDFGDGATSPEKAPTHVYRETGMYDVTLTVESSLGSCGRYTRHELVDASSGTIAASDGERVCASAWTNPYSPFGIPGWFGDESGDGGFSIADIDGNDIPDMIVFHIDNPDGDNHGFYRIGWNISDNGTVSAWSDPVQIPGWFGAESQGGGVAVADINGNGIPDLLVFHIDHPLGGNRGYYRIGWDLSDAGTVAAWTEPLSIPGWFGNESQGGGLAVADINDNGKPDMIVFNIDNPDGDNHGYYRIGWDVSSDGTIDVTDWTDPVAVPGWFGGESQGAGIALDDINGNAVPDLVVFHIDHPAGENHGYYRVGWDLDGNGAVSSWMGHRRIPGWFGKDSQGGGVWVYDISGNGSPDLGVFHINHPAGANVGVYRVGWDVQPDGRICAVCTLPQ